jgi:iron complex transport system ATP-binding protein
VGLLDVRGLWAGYHGNAVLRGINLGLEEGEVLAIVGPNGAGKTTLVRCIARMLRPMRGVVAVNGRDLWRMPLGEAARLFSYLPPPPPPGFNIRVADLVASMMQPHLGDSWPSDDARRLVSDVLGMVDAGDMAHRRIDELSSGELKRIMLAAALSKPARLVLLDEPVAHLDLRFQAEAALLIRRAARERGVGILAATHNLTAASIMADRIAVISEGRIHAVGRPEDILVPEVLEPVYGVSVGVVNLDGARVVVPRVAKQS